MGIGSLIFDFKSLKEKISYLYPLPNHKLHFADLKMICGQNVYHLMRPTRYKCCQQNDPWAVLGWTLSRPLSKNVANTISAATQFLQADEVLI